MKKQIVLDTETTGFKPENGDRVIEIGAIELIDGKKTGRTLQLYINPEREIPEEAIKIHGITNDFIKDKPIFAKVVDEFIDFIKDAEILAHNAEFDIKFLNNELSLVNKGSLWNYAKMGTCTMKLDKKLFAKEKHHSLDAMCNRLEISNEHRQFHGALLDAELLAECYLKINTLYPQEIIESDLEQKNWKRPEIKRFENLKLKKIDLTDSEQQAHINYLTNLEKETKNISLFNKNNVKLKMV